MPTSDTRLWATVIGWFVLIFGGGAAWGQHRSQLIQHQRLFDNCNIGKLMTEDKCKAFHETHSEVSVSKLNNIEILLHDIKEDKKESDQKMGALAARIDVIFDRWEQKHG